MAVSAAPTSSIPDVAVMTSRGKTPARKIHAVVLVMFAIGCGNNGTARTPSLEFAKDFKYDKSVMAAWGGRARELPDGRIVVANFHQQALSLLSRDGKVIANYNAMTPGVAQIDSLGSIGVASDGTILTVARQDNGIRLFFPSDSGLKHLRTIPVKTVGWITAMCVAGSRIYIAGMKFNNDSTHELVHEVDWSGNVLKSFARLPKASSDSVRRFRASQIACTANRVVLAPTESDELYFYDGDGERLGVIAVPEHGEAAFEKSSDLIEVKVRSDAWDASNRIRYAPDGRLLVQYDHYVGKALDSHVSLTFDEKTGWSLPKRNGPRILAIGQQYAYGVDLYTSEFIRYRYD